MKRTTVILSLLALTLALFSCGEKGKENEPKGGEDNIKVVTLDPTSIKLEVGKTETIKVSWTPKTIKATPTFVSKNEKIATVDANGVVTAVDKGRTTIEVTVGKITKDCSIVVSKPGEGPTVLDNELPGLYYLTFWDNSGNLKNAFSSKDEVSQILAYEKKIGRVQEKEFPFSKDVSIPGFVNKDLALIPAVTYGLFLDFASMTIAYVKETVESCEETLAMLKSNGFSNAEVVKDKDNKPVAIRASHDEKKYIRVIGTNSEDGKKYDATMQLRIFKTYLSDFKKHEMLPDVKDFPSYEKLMTGDINQIKAFEETLGFRVWDNQSGENPSFNTPEAKYAETNIAFASYVLKPKSGPQFINCAIIGLGGGGDLASKETQAWMKANGYPEFEKNQNGEAQIYWYGEHLFPGLNYFSADKKTTALILMMYNQKNGAVFPIMEISASEKGATLQQKRAMLQLPQRLVVRDYLPEL